MVIELTFKTPDVVEYALEDLSDEEKEKAEEACAIYVQYGEQVTIAIDSETGNATVVPAI